MGPNFKEKIFHDLYLCITTMPFCGSQEVHFLQHPPHCMALGSPLVHSRDALIEVIASLLAESHGLPH